MNAGSKLGAEVVGRLLQFGLIYLAQRTLGPEGYGQYTYAVAVGFVLAPVSDLGVQLSVTRELARDAGSAARIAGVGLAIKLPLALIVGVLLLLVSWTRPPAVQTAALVLGMSVVLASFVDFLGYTFRGLQRVDYEARLTLAFRFLTASLGATALWAGWGLLGLAIAHAAGATAAVLLV